MSLPKKWHETDFESILESITNGIADKQNQESKGIPVTRIETIASGIVNYNKIGYVEGYDEEKQKKYKLNEGDILFSHINSPLHLGKTAIYKNEYLLYHGTNLLRLVVNPKVCDYRMFNYYCKYLRLTGEFSQKAQHAVNQSSLNQKKLKAFSFPLPPLNEQKRIAKKLDELLATVESIKTRLNNAPSIIKRFRQSILAAATSGKLTEEWREVNRVTEEWKNIALEDATTKVGSGSTPRGGKSAYKESGIPLVRSMNIHFNGIKYKDLAFIDDEQAKKLSNVIIQENDVLLNITGASIGRVTLAPEDLVGARVNQHVSIIRTKDNELLPEYLNIYLASPVTQKWIQAENYGGTREALTKTMILEYEVPQPSIQEQKEIVSQVESLFALVDTLEEKIEAAKKRVDKLTQSILAKAFKGELVPQDPNDEPAEELLKRIKAEQEKEKPRQTINKKKRFTRVKCKTSDELFKTIDKRFKKNPFTIDDIQNSTTCTFDEVTNYLFELIEDNLIVIKTENNKKIYKIG